MTRFRINFFVAITITFYSALCGSEPVPLPTAEYEDAISTTDAELAALRNWVSESFLDTFPSGDAAPIRIDVPHQDHSVLGYGQSCIETPIRVGSRSFEHGLGTHANSEIVFPCLMARCISTRWQVSTTTPTRQACWAACSSAWRLAARKYFAARR